MRFKFGKPGLGSSPNPRIARDGSGLFKLLNERNRNFSGAIVSAPPLADICGFLRILAETKLFRFFEPIADATFSKKRVSL